MEIKFGSFYRGSVIFFRNFIPLSVTYSYPRIVYFIYETRDVENFFRRWIKKVIDESLIFFSIIASKNIYIIIGKLSQEVTIRNIDINCVYIYIYTR